MVRFCYKHRITPWKWVTKPSSDIGTYFWALSVSGLVKWVKTSTKSNMLEIRNYTNMVSKKLQGITADQKQTNE